MTTSELTRAIFQRLKKYFYLIILLCAIFTTLLVLYAKNTPVTLTSRASVFPINSPTESSSTSSYLSALMGGGGDAGKNFSPDDASINIVELALSRSTREAVADAKVQSMGNKTIAEILINDINNHIGWMETKIEMPKTELGLITVAGNILKGGLTATINKNNTLILTYTGRSEDVVKIITYTFIEKISKFYIDLKREKAKYDFEFATRKVDSLRAVMNAKDYLLIEMDKRTLFTNTNKLQFRVPTENLIQEKQMIRNQYITAVSNQQNAAYKLQKATPIIKVLDYPEPPYDIQKKSKVMYGIIGFIIGIVLSIALLISGLILRFIKEETNKLVFGAPKNSSTTTTATAL